MKKFISVLVILTLSLALCVYPVIAEETSYYGNVHIFNSYKSYYLNSEIKKCSIRFTAIENKTVDGIQFWSAVGGGVSPIYRIGLQSDDGSGKPDGNWLGSLGLGYQDTTLNANSWNAITLGEGVSVTAGGVYHIVAHWVSGTVDSSNFRSCGLSFPFNPFVPLDGENDPYWNFLDTEVVTGGSRWTVRDLTPIFILNFNDGSWYGNPYNGMGGPWITNGVGEQFTVDSSITVSGVALYIKKVGTPAGYFVLYDVTNDQVIEKIPVPADVVPTSFNWVEASFSQNYVLMPGVTYQIYGYTTTETANRWVGKSSAAAAGHEALTWRGTSDFYVSGDGDNPPLATGDAARDFPFRFTLFTGPPTKGTLSVDTTPVPGEIFVDGESWGIAPQARLLPEGNYTVSFGDVPGYVTPSPQNATVTVGQTTSVLGTYELAMGTLSVDTTPVSGEVFVDGESWGVAPQAGTLQEGNYTVSFGDVSGYVTPPPQTAAVVEGETTEVLGTYERIIGKGTLEVDTTPVKGEVFVDGKSWGIAPQSQTVPEGNYTVSFGDFLGYVTPPPQNVTVVEGETTSVLGTYEPAPGTGTLSVDTTPVNGEVFVDGESWGIAPQARRLPEGTYTVSFGDVVGYEKPSPQNATIVADTTTSVTGIYEIEIVSTVVTTWEYPFEGTPRGIVAARCGPCRRLHNFFFLDSENNVVQVYPYQDRFIKWTIPTPNSGASFGICIDDVHRVYLTEPNANKIGELVSTQTPSPFIEWILPPSDNGQSKLYGIAVTSSWVYFTDIDGDRVGQLITRKNSFTMWSLPSGRQPSGITHLGSIIYFLESNRIARLDPATSTLTEWIVPSSFGSWSGYIFASQGFLFVTSEDGNKIGRFDPSTNLFTEWTVPTSNSAPKGMWISPYDPSLRAYFAESGSGKIGLLLDTSSGGTETLLSFTNVTLVSSSVAVTPVETAVAPTVVTVPRTVTEVDGVVDGSFIEWPLPVPPVGLEALAPSTLRLFFTHNSGIIGRFQLVVDTISEWTLPETVNPQSLGLESHEGKAIFFTDSDNKIGRLDVIANTLTLWTLPSSEAKPFEFTPECMVTPPLFFAEEGVNKIARFDPATNTLTEWTVPTPDSRPRGIWRSPGSSFVYFAEYGANKIGMLDLDTNTFTEWTIPTAASGTTYVFWWKNGLAFTETDANKIGFLDFSTNTLREWIIPTANSLPTAMITLDGGYLYFAESGSNKIGRIAIYNWGTVFDEWELPTENPDGPDAIPSIFRSVQTVFFMETTSNKIAFFDHQLSPRTTYIVEPTTTTLAPTTSEATPVETTLTPQVQTVPFTWTTVIGVVTDGLVEWEVPTAESKPLGIMIAKTCGVFFAESGAHKIGRLYGTAWIPYQ